MFWNAVNEGLATFTHWETWVCILVWLMVTGLPRLLVLRAVAGPEESRHIGGIYLMLTPFIQAIAMSFLILTLSPLVFGLGEQAAWRFPWSMLVDAPGPTLKMIVAVFVAWLLSLFEPDCSISNLLCRHCRADLCHPPGQHLERGAGT